MMMLKAIGEPMMMRQISDEDANVKITELTGMSQPSGTY